MQSRLLFLVQLLPLLRVLSQHYDLSENLLVNGDFSQPISSQLLLIRGSPLTIPGWYCSDQCQIDNCKARILSFVRGKRFFPNCTGQVLDVDADGVIQNVSQDINLDYGQYSLQFDYFWPYSNAFKKTLLVYFNDQLVFSCSPNLFGKMDSLNFSTVVYAKTGINRLVFTQTNSSFNPNDAVGFRITNVSLRSITNKDLQLLLKKTIDSSVSVNINLIPGSRVIFSELINMFINLDRYQFYYYHNRNYSTNTLIFIKGINLLLKQKGSLFSLIINNTQFNQGLSNFISSLDYKAQYSDSSYLKKDNNGNSFILNNGLQILLNMPFYFSLILFGNLLYSVSKKCFVSKYLKKYTMYVIILLMMIEGNVEQFSYYMFAELSNFFSACFRHKIINIVLLMIFFIITLASVGIVWFIVLHYKRQAKRIFEWEYRNLSFMTIMLQKGIVCFLLGAIHILLRNSPILQLFMLMGVQVCFLVLKSIVIYNHLSKNNLEYVICLCQGVIRILLQYLFYIESQQSSIKIGTESTLQKTIIYCFLIVWGFSCLHSVWKILHFIIKNIKFLVTKIFSTPKVIDLKTKLTKRPQQRYKQHKNNVPQTPSLQQKQKQAELKDVNKKQNKIRFIFTSKRPNKLNKKVEIKEKRDKLEYKSSKKEPVSLYEGTNNFVNQKLPCEQATVRLKNVLAERRKNKNLGFVLNIQEYK